MDCGFETIGNATLLVYDQGPVLCTDPWVVGGAYFGSWTLSHEVPPEQLEAVKRARYAWLSHGHPDHLSGDSLKLLQERTLLLPDHVGGRVKRDLVAQGFHVQVLADRVWTPLSARVKVLCISDYNQDAVLLVDVDGKLVVNLNDASDRGWGRFVRQVIETYDESFLLALTGFGDAGMINVFDESGRRVPPNAAKKSPVGRKISRLLDKYPAKYFVPFSSMHRYQREDSIWADAYSTRLEDYAVGFDSNRAEMLPAFIRYDALGDRVDELKPKEIVVTPLPAKSFGDDWRERLEKDEARLVTRYFQSIEHIGQVLDFVNVRVGGEDHVVSFRQRGLHKGITFEVPRHSLLTAIQYEIFDDLLIGNFMKTTLHGHRKPHIDRDFAVWVAKYADNGRAKKVAEVREYLAAYWRRDPVGFLHSAVERGVVRPAEETVSRLMREKLGNDSRLFLAAKRTWHEVRRALH